MKSVVRIIGWALLAALVVGAYAGYRIGWGTPFNINQLSNRQMLVFASSEPELLTQLGLIDGTIFDTHSGKLSDISKEHQEKTYARAEKFLAEVKKFDRSRLKGEDVYTYDIMTSFYDDILAYRKYDWLGDAGIYPFNQISGLQTSLPDFLLNGHVVKNPKTARNYVKRLDAMSTKLEQGIAETQRLASVGVTPPVAIIDKTLVTIDDFLKTTPEEHPLVVEFQGKLEKVKGLSDAEKKDLVEQAKTIVSEEVYPVYHRIADLMNEIRPQAAENPAAGVYRLPDGKQYYADSLRESTTTDKTPDEIHEIGLAEVARITAEADGILQSIGMSEGTVGERLSALASDPSELFEDSDAGREQILDGYRAILVDIEKRLPDYFATIPEQKIEVRRVPVYSQAGAPGAYFQPAALDGSRPGAFYANLQNVEETPKWGMKTLAYHEGISGHFFQISISQHLKGLPFIRQQSIYSAYTEGWALYAEHLAKEMGAYEGDPKGDLGRLQAELFRAVRLVVDTGLHAKGWTREQAIDYMHAATGMPLTDVTREVERYMVWPGQACAYKIGMLKILELRQRAKDALGDKFDLKAFHEQVLNSGALPLTLLDHKISAWIEEQKKAAS